MDKKQNPSQENLRHESDTAKLVHRHLSDPNHVFTEDELASIRVGSTPMPDLAAQSAREDNDERIADRDADGENEL